MSFGLSFGRLGGVSGGGSLSPVESVLARMSALSQTEIDAITDYVNGLVADGAYDAITEIYAPCLNATDFLTGFKFMTLQPSASPPGHTPGQFADFTSNNQHYLDSENFDSFATIEGFIAVYNVFTAADTTGNSDLYGLADVAGNECYYRWRGNDTNDFNAIYNVTLATPRSASNVRPTGDLVGMGLEGNDVFELQPGGIIVKSTRVQEGIPTTHPCQWHGQNLSGTPAAGNMANSRYSLMIHANLILSTVLQGSIRDRSLQFLIDIGVSGVPGGPFAGPYLLQAEFNADDISFFDAQVLDTAVEGVTVGSFTVTQPTGTEHAIVSNQFELKRTDAGALVSGIASNSFPREIGLGHLAIVTYDLANTRCTNGFHDSATLVSGGIQLAVKNDASGVCSAQIGGVAIANVITVSTATEYQFFIIVGGYDSSEESYTVGDTKANYPRGGHLFIKGGVFTNWTHMFQHFLGATSPLFAQALVTFGTPAVLMDELMVADHDYSAVLEPKNMERSVTTSTTFTHDADCLIEYHITTLPDPTGVIRIIFRDNWALEIDDTGAIDLIEDFGGTPVSRGTSSGVLDGWHIIIRMDDEHIDIWGGTFGTVRQIDFTSAAANKTATAGDVRTLDIGAAVAFIGDWSKTSSVYDEEFENV